jgi:hypothetical protein
MTGLCWLNQETGLQMKRLSYLLILLLLSAQVDDAWAVSPNLPSAPLADDNDEYLPAQRRAQGEQSSSRQKPVFAGRKPQTADCSPVRRGVPPEWSLTAPFAPPPLYVFMSLQL